MNKGILFAFSASLLVTANAAHDDNYHSSGFNWNEGSSQIEYGVADAKVLLSTAQSDLVSAQAAYNAVDSADLALLADAKAALDAANLAVSDARTSMEEATDRTREVMQTQRSADSDSHSGSMSGDSSSMGGGTGSGGGHGGGSDSSGGMGSGSGSGGGMGGGGGM